MIVIGSPFCNHLKPHKIFPPKDEQEKRFRKFLHEGGWIANGYCYAYYPRWLWETFKKQEEAKR